MAKSRDAFRTISEVADWLDTPAHVLRFWESKFTQVKPIKRAGGRRYYRPADMELLGGIKRLLHDDGMTIKGVQKILREQGVRHVASLSAQSVEDETEDRDEMLIEDAPFVDVEPDAAATEPLDFAAAVRARGGVEQGDAPAEPETDGITPTPAEPPANDADAPVAATDDAEAADAEPEPSEVAERPAPDDVETLADEDPVTPAEAPEPVATEAAPVGPAALEPETGTGDLSADTVEIAADASERHEDPATQSDDVLHQTPEPLPDSDLVEAGAEDWLPEQEDEDPGTVEIDAEEYAALTHVEGASPSEPEPEPEAAETSAQDDIDPATLPAPEPGPLTWISAARRLDADRSAALAAQLAALSALHDRLSAPLRR